MSVIEKLKAKSLDLKRSKNFELAASVAFVLSEIEKVGKNNGNRVTTEDEAIKVVRNVLTRIDESMKYDFSSGKASQEKAILESVLPQMVSYEEVRVEIATCVAFGQNKGQIMKHLRAKFGSLVDMRTAAQIIDEIGVA